MDTIKVIVMSVLMTVLSINASSVFATEDCKLLNSSGCKSPSGYYIKGQYGQVNSPMKEQRLVELSQSELVDSLIFAEQDSSFSLGVGYQFTPFWAIEVSYISLGNRALSITGDAENSASLFDTAEALLPKSPSGYTINNLMTIPITEKFSIGGKFGLFQGKSILKKSFNDDKMADIETKDTQFWYGLELGYRYSDNLQLFLSTSEIPTENTKNKVYSVGLRHFFSQKKQGYSARVNHRNKHLNNSSINSPPINNTVNSRQKLNKVDQCDGSVASEKAKHATCEQSIGRLVRHRLVIYFDRESDVIAEQYESNIEKTVGLIKSHNLKQITIYGHASSPGTEMYNQQLSEQRAHALRQHLIEKYNLMIDIQVVGEGERKLLTTEQSPAANAKNRRVDTIIEFTKF